MRNLKQYPVTIDEIQKALNEQADELLKLENIGDMRPYLLRLAARIIGRAAFAVTDLEQEK